ncbi:hypothetical protein [Microbulbifer discodermiae]|uniref:hypothetical protein n=1 Tax=Microbulbifer sp. 2201CG32-9 TaxID=3232309 RepID=UPI00345C0D9B
MDRRIWWYLLVVLVLISGCKQPDGEEPLEEPIGEAAESIDKSEATAAPAVSPEQMLWVYQARGNRQCEGGGISLEESAGKLTENGIAVQESSCGGRTDRLYPSVCGGPTGDILLHLIHRDSLDASLELGFDPVSRIEYQRRSCAPAGAKGERY